MANIDINQKIQHGMMAGEPVSSKESTTLSAELLSRLDQVFDLIFESSKQVLGNITSIGIKYGKSLKSPDHMLVVFPEDVHGFEGWNNTSGKSRWRYQRRQKTILKNGVAVNETDAQPFVAFVQASLDAIQQQQVAFSKNITHKELQEVR